LSSRFWVSYPSVRWFSHDSSSIVVFQESGVEGEVGVVGSFVVAVGWVGGLLNKSCSLFVVVTGWFSNCDCGRWCGSGFWYYDLGWSSVIWVSLPSVRNFSDSGFSSVGFDQVWSSGKKSIVSGFIVSSGFSHGSVWISFDLSISTWIWLLVWVVDVFVIIRLFLISEVQWFLELLDSIILLINFLWNKTGWSIWVDLSLGQGSWWGSSLRSWKLCWSSIFSISFPSIWWLSYNIWTVESINENWSSWKIGVVSGVSIVSSFSERSVWILFLNKGFSLFVIVTGWFSNCDFSWRCGGGLWFWDLGWTSIIWVSLPSVGYFSDSSFSGVGFD